MSKKTVVLNRICTGDYLDEGTNLGHEIVNLFKSDKTEKQEGSYYVYLMSDGTYPHSRVDDEVQKVYFTKGINAGCVEVVAVASGITPVFKPCKGWKCFQGGGGKKEVDTLFFEELSMENLQKVQKKVPFDDSLLGWLETKSFQGMKPFSDNRKEEMSEKAQALYNLADELEAQPNKNDYAALCKAIRRRAAHIEQLVYIIKNDVRYGGKRINELFAYNSSEQYGLAIYLTYKAEKIERPVQKTYIIADWSYKVDVEGVKNILIERDRLATTTLATYFDERGTLPKKDKIVLDESGEKIRVLDEKTGKTKSKRRKLTKEELDTARNKEKENFKRLIECKIQGKAIEPYQEVDVANDFTFLSLIKKEYDEIIYSNMMQYFFTCKPYRPLFVDFLKSYGVELSDNYKIRREEAYIDLLVEDDNWVIVIENKIKSGLNGLIFDENDDLQGTQLQTYKNYVEGHSKYKNKKKAYFIFKPNYSMIPGEDLEGYIPVSYGELAECFEKGLGYEADMETKVYFSDFIKALKLHATDTDNRQEEIMRKRLHDLLMGLHAN